MNFSCDQKHLNDWKGKSIIAIVIGGSDIIAYVISSLFNAAILSIIPISIITLFGVMALSSFHSLTPIKKEDASPGTKIESGGIMRKSLTATLILVFVIVFALSLSGQVDFSKIPSSLADNFVFIIITIIGFYFGTKGVTDFLKAKKT